MPTVATPRVHRETDDLRFYVRISNPAGDAVDLQVSWLQCAETLAHSLNQYITNRTIVEVTKGE